MSFPQRVNTVEAKNRLNELIGEVVATKEAVVIEKRGEPIAVVLDYESYQKNKILPSQKRRKKEKDFLFLELKNFHRYLRKKYPRKTGDSVEILREIREKRISR